MNVTPRKREEMDRRRASVARYRAQGYKLDAICDALAAEGQRHPSGKRWSRKTITTDLDYLKERYVLDADADVALWLNSELEILNFAMQSAVQGVADKTKIVVGYQHVQRRDPATGAMSEIKNPIFETVENLAAIDRVVKVAESRRKLLAIDRVFKMQQQDKDEIADAVAGRIADAFSTAPGKPLVASTDGA